jgi:hypothetical protein
MTLAANFATNTAGVFDTGGKLSSVSMAPAVNMPPVSSIRQYQTAYTLK